MRDVLNLPTQVETAESAADGLPGRVSRPIGSASEHSCTAPRGMGRVTEAIAFAVERGAWGDRKVETKCEPPKLPEPAAPLRMAGHRPKVSTAAEAGGGAGANTAFFASSERRQFPRRDSGSTVKLHVLGENETQGDERRTDWLLRSSSIRAELLDISMSGLALGVTEPVAENARLLLRLENRQFDRRLDTIAVVLRCEGESGDGGRRLVCRFERKLSFEQVHDFGRHLFPSAIV